jgi:Domain of unknown function
VDYDASFLKHDMDAQRVRQTRNQTIASNKTLIAEVVMEDASDYESLTVLYRKIFRFLLDFAPNSTRQDKLIEREVATALESVFPRVGLKTFVQLLHNEKISQLEELANIVLGIRLFNRHQGGGGAGIDDMDKDGKKLAVTMLDDVSDEVQYFTASCMKYQQAVVRAQFMRRRADMSVAVEETKGGCAADRRACDLSKLVPLMIVERWLKELVNRRQYLGFLKTLQGEISNVQVRMSEICRNIGEVLESVQLMVTNKANVSKELVYPRFESLGALWVGLFEEVTLLLARSSTLSALCKYRMSFTPTLDDSYYETIMSQSIDVYDDYAPDSEFAPSLSDIECKSESKGDHKPYPPSSSSCVIEDHKAEVKNSHADCEDDIDDGSAVGASTAAESAEASKSTDAGATLLSAHDTPDFLLLPLELQGYCPWSMVHAHGLLLPGKPALGVVRYQNMYYVCEHAKAIASFMLYPERYLQNIRARSLQNPEYIHLLRLQRWFPHASISKLLQTNESGSAPSAGRPAMRDASTGTPTHFIESNMDINYHWNEWELRRRALKIANLTGCKTSSQQTDSSHFRREAGSQVCTLRDKDTQTKRDKGTNPPVITTYIAGLRGTPAVSSRAVSKYVKKNSGEGRVGGDCKEGKESSHPMTQPNHERLRARIVTLKLDL